MEKIIVGTIDWLRNDYRRDITIGGMTFPTLEHAYQASKSKDREVWKQIANTESVREARKIGRRLNKRSDFDGEVTMMLLLRQKFSEKDLGEMLAKTGTAPIVMEGYDEFWGTGNEGEGQNVMGELMQTLRSDLQFIFGIDPVEEQDTSEDEEDVPTLKQALIKFGVDYLLADACQDLLEGSKAVMSVVDANDYNAEYISRKTGVDRTAIEEVIEKVKSFSETIKKLDYILETPSDDASSDEDESDEDDGDDDDDQSQLD